MQRAHNHNLLKELWDEVEQETNDGKYPINPFITK